jgi:hypothetical protein
VFDDTFYEAVDAAGAEAQVSVDFDKVTVAVHGVDKTWKFELSELDAGLLRKKGAMNAYKNYGVHMYD